jgi:hypothetical protein
VELGFAVVFQAGPDASLGILFTFLFYMFLVFATETGVANGRAHAGARQLAPSRAILFPFTFSRFFSFSLLRFF